VHARGRAQIRRRTDLSQQLPDLRGEKLANYTRSERREISKLYQIRRRTDLSQELFVCINTRSQPRTTNTTTNQKNRLPGRSVTTARGRRRESSSARERRRESSHAGETGRESLLAGGGELEGERRRERERWEGRGDGDETLVRGERDGGRAQPGSRGTHLLVVSHGPG
jgi:hypothetical protein